MGTIIRIATDGYRGPLSTFQFIPPGEYTVGERLNIAERQLPAELALHMVKIEKARLLQYEETPEPETIEEPEAPAVTVIEQPDETPGTPAPTADDVKPTRKPRAK